MINVLFIAYHFPPVGGAGVQRTLGFVRHLPDLGFLPVVVTGPGTTEGRWTPTDEGFMSKIPPAVPICRTKGPMGQDSPNPLVRLARRFFCLTDGFSKWWVPSATAQGEKTIGERKIDLIYASMSPFESAAVAGHLSASFGMPWVADLRDPWVLDEMQVYYSAIHRGYYQRRMHASLSSASAIIMNTPGAASALRETFPDLAGKKVVSITNGFDAEDFAGPAPARNDGRFRIVHSGYLHTELGMDLEWKRGLLKMLGGIDKGVSILTRSHVILIKALESWIKTDPTIVDYIEVRFVGVAAKIDMEVVRQSPISQIIHFTGYVPHEESVKEIRMADLLFLPMHKVETGYRTTIVPGKLYEYMASGRPVLAAVPEGDAKDYLIESGLGLACKPDDQQTMAEILDKAYRAWKKKETLVSPNKDFVARFERKVLAGKLAEVFRGHVIQNN